ncbi:hypothetical protein J5Y03_09965 [Bacillus sp. RG28]|uniref:Uncharacterized protein n=1 Tax=Gottfriedia endophytica TaxID=2820819 RepID=A0A940NR91_9BACI|nr:hypothetical protein [Gottfriedia endophytica]MBP0725512.1 hypothetical protein [Gottfriedia endophytica]
MYSALNLLEIEELRNGTRREQKQYAKYYKNKQYLTLDIPHKVLQRARAFCEDVTEMNEYWEYELSDLFEILVSNFIKWMREQSDPKDVYSRLQEINRYIITSFPNEKEKKHLIISGNHKNDFRPITVSFDYNVVLRLEVLLDDMNYIYKKHGYTVEVVIASLMCDYIRKVQSDGKGMAKDIVDYILVEWEDRLV